LFIRNVLLTLLTEFAAVGGNFVIGVLLARSLSVPERGIMVLVMTLPLTVAGLANLGLPQANIYLIGRKKYSASTVLGNSLIAAAVLGGLAVLILVLLREQVLSTALRGLPEEYYIPLLVLVPLLLLDGVLLSVLRARLRFDLFNLRRFVSTLFLLAGFSGVLLLTQGGIHLLVWVYIAATVLMVVFSFALTRRDVPLQLSFNPSFTAASARFGMKSYLQNLAGALTYRLDVYLLAFFLSPEQVAYYAIATALAEVAWYIPDTVGVVLFPRLSNTPLEEIHAVTARVLRTTLAVVLVVTAGMASVSWFLVPFIYGAAYAASVVPLLILLPGIVVMGIYKVVTRNFSSRDRQQVSILAAFLALSMNVALNVVLIPIWGVSGAALASTLAYSSAGLIMLFAFQRESQLPWSEILLPRVSELTGHLRWARAAFMERI
jgi:O-antigen/teichoic acid export membrane protein